MVDTKDTEEARGGAAGGPSRVTQLCPENKSSQNV